MTKVDVIERPTESRPSSITLFSRIIKQFRELSIVPALIVLVIIGSVTNPVFLTEGNILNLLSASSVLGLLVIAETLVLIVGEFDLSVQSIVAFAPVLVAVLITAKENGGSGMGMNPYLGIIICLAGGTLVGIFNGFLVVKVRLNAFVVTLAMLILVQGLAQGAGQGKTIFGIPEPFIWLGTASVASIPVDIIVTGLVFLVVGVFLRSHSIGRSLYAIGGNPEAARVAGIRVERTIWVVFAFSGFLAGLAGMMLTGRLASATDGQGSNIIFSVMAACVVGGVSLAGGQGRMVGALAGVLLLAVIENLLTLAQVAVFWVDATYGAIILLALVIGRVAGDASAHG